VLLYFGVENYRYTGESFDGKGRKNLKERSLSNYD
jgi:hypothetical protein